MEDGGILGINLEHIKPDNKSDQPETIRLTITDTGIGMTEETVNQIFNPFFTTREIGQGKGFSLSIVFNILKNMGGSISATSVFGDGSSFVIEFQLENRSED